MLTIEGTNDGFAVACHAIYKALRCFMVGFQCLLYWPSPEDVTWLKVYNCRRNSKFRTCSLRGFRKLFKLVEVRDLLVFEFEGKL